MVMRDTLRRNVVLNGGTLRFSGEQDNRGIDLYKGPTVTVNDDSLIVGVGGGYAYNDSWQKTETVVTAPRLCFRGGNVTFNVAFGKTLVNNYQVSTAYKDGLTKTGAGTMQMNGVEGAELNDYGTTTINGGTYEVNCHNNGNNGYTVADGTKLRGTGAITGAGGVTLASANAKLCGSLTIANLTAMSGGIIGENWDEDAIALSITNSLTAAGTLNLKNGSFTIGADCAVTNAAGTANTTDATFSIAANANLVLGKSVTVGALTVADGGSITLAGARNSAAQLTVAGTLTQSGKINIVLDFGDRNPPPSAKFPLLAAAGVNLANVTLRDKGNVSKWRITYENGVVYGSTDSGFAIRLR